MKNRTAAATCLWLAGLLGLLLGAQACGAEALPDMLPASEVRPGMTGYGLTCLQGVRPEKFDVEVLGVLKGAFPKGDIILIRMSGPVIDETGAISGMSGSPVYIDDKLLGAVAYGWRYCKVPLAGVTPAREMMRVQQIDREADRDRTNAAKAHARRTLRATSRHLVKLLTSPERNEEAAPQIRRAVMQMALPPCLTASADLDGLSTCPPALSGLLPEGADPRIQRLAIPLAVGGMPVAGRPLLSLFDDSQFMPVQAAASGAGADAAQQATLEPGVPVGAAFVSGDMDIAGIGTLTWIEGDRVMAFGHPLFGSGETDIPLAIGDVQAVVPSVLQSFKLTSIGKIVGRITQDRETAVLAKLGEEALTFPCKVRVTGTVDDTYDYRVTGYWETAPFFTLLAVGSSCARWEGRGNRYTLTAKATLSLKGREEPIVLKNVYNSLSVLPPAMDLVAMPMEMLLLNPYRDVEIDGLDYELEVKPGFEAALIESVWADRTRAEPGAEITLYVRLLQYRGERVVKKLSLQIPETAKPGSQAEVLVCGAMTNRMIERGLDPGFFAPRDFESLVDMLERMQPNRNLVMRASFFEQGVRYAGGAMPALPPSALSVLEYNRLAGQIEPLVTDIVQSAATPWVLEGAQSLSITIKRPQPHRP